jgi:hypothetical protein
VSGSWVVRNEKLCGYIIAVQDGSPWMYMLPIEGVFEDIVSFTGSTRVGLVSEMDPELATQQTNIKPAESPALSILPRASPAGIFNRSTQHRQRSEDPLSEPSSVIATVVPPAAPPGMVVQPRRIRIRLPRIFKPSNWGQPRRRRRPVASKAPFWSRVAKMFDLAHIWSALEVFFRHLRKAIDARRSALELLKIAIRYQLVLYILLSFELYVPGESVTITTITSI